MRAMSLVGPLPASAFAPRIRALVRAALVIPLLPAAAAGQLPRATIRVQAEAVDVVHVEQVPLQRLVSPAGAASGSGVALAVFGPRHGELSVTLDRVVACRTEGATAHCRVGKTAGGTAWTAFLPTEAEAPLILHLAVDPAGTGKAQPSRSVTVTLAYTAH